MKPGRKPQSAEILQLRGTYDPSRPRVGAVEALPGDPIRPQWLSGRARRIWDDKCARCKARGQHIRGCEDALAQYWALEADLIERRRREGYVPVAMINAHRIFCGEFFDTPALQNIRPAGGGKDNPFAGHGKKPA